MLGNCERCGALIYVNSGKRSLCPDCRKQAQSEKESYSQKEEWTIQSQKSQVQLVTDNANARRIGLSYGNYMAAIHDDRDDETDDVDF